MIDETTPLYPIFEEGEKPSPEYLVAINAYKNKLIVYNAAITSTAIATEGCKDVDVLERAYDRLCDLYEETCEAHNLVIQSHPHGLREEDK